METASRPSDAADTRQAEVFCVLLHRELAEIDSGIAKLTATLARVTGHRLLGAHVVSAREDLRLAQERRRELLGMLRALDHPFPCRHD